MNLYDDTIRPAVIPYLSTPFLLSSPSNGESEGPWLDDNPNSQWSGDIHYYNYTTNCLDTSTLPIPRFASEFGWQSYPALSTLTSALHTRDITLATTEHRQHLVNGSDLLALQLINMFSVGPAGNYGNYGNHLSNLTLVYLSQLHQSICLTAQIGHFRRWSTALHPGDGRGMTAGALFWQLNDVWAAPTWSVLDVNMRPKMAWYGIRDQGYKEVMVVGHWNGTHAVLTLATLPHHPVVSTLSLDIFMYDVRSTASLCEWGLDLRDVPGGAEIWAAGREELAGKCNDLKQCFIAAELTIPTNDGGSRTTTSTTIIKLGFDWKGVSLHNPHLSAVIIHETESGELWVRVRSEAIAVWVWLEVDGSCGSGSSGGVFSRNNFVMYVPEVIVIFTPDNRCQGDCHDNRGIPDNGCHGMPDNQFEGLQGGEERDQNEKEEGDQRFCKVHVTSLYNHVE
eukprot:sb/3464604/